MQLNLSAVSTESLLPAALDLAVAHDLTACDACYIALASLLALPLLAANEKQIDKMRSQTYDIRMLSDLEVPIR